ncbi:hypothetical protein DNTS_021690, partial [Danionella cerebrum]
MTVLFGDGDFFVLFGARVLVPCSSEVKECPEISSAHSLRPRGVMSCQEVPNSNPNPSQEPKDPAVLPAGVPKPDNGSTQAVPSSSPKLPAVTVKTEAPSENASSNGKMSDGGLPAEICVVLGNARNAQAQGSYICGVCGKKYKYYNCFQTHVRAHTEAEGTVSAEGAVLGINSSFRYTCDVCGKKYKYYSCFQEHRDLHAVDDPYDHMIPLEELKEETETFQKIGPKTGSYTCEFCGKQYKYFNPYQEHVALHTPLSKCSLIYKLSKTD